MGIFDEFPPKEAAIIFAVAFAYILFMASPILIGGWVAVRRRPRPPKRWLFLAVLLVGSYGLLSAVGFLALLPTQAYLVFIAPQLDAAHLVKGGPLTYAADLFVRYWWLIYGPSLLAICIWLYKYLSPRWAAIAAALEG